MKFLLPAAVVLLLGSATLWAEPKAMDTPPAAPRYTLPKPVRATAAAPDSAAGKTLRFTYPKGAGIRCRDCYPSGEKQPWPAWGPLAAATEGNFTFNDRNSCSGTTGEGTREVFRSTITYQKLSKGEAQVTVQTDSPYTRCTTIYRLVFTSPTSGTASARVMDMASETEMTHFHFTLD